MEQRCFIQGRCLDESDVEHVRHLIDSHPSWSRKRISIELACDWNWRNARGRLKDMAARSLMLKLEQRGLLRLPARRRVSPKRKCFNTDTVFDEPSVITEALVHLQPLSVHVMRAGNPDHTHFSRYLARYHYLGFRGPVGENLGYLVRDCHGRDLACVLFGAAAWKTKPRDIWIGWNGARVRHLSFITNNTRFLILPWVQVAHLASHVLGCVLRRLAEDWQAKYGHAIYLVETFVNRDRFRGTCYRAANWVHVGSTQGRSRQDRTHTLRVPVKDIYVYALKPDFRERLIHG